MSLWVLGYFVVGFVVSLPGMMEISYRDRTPLPWVIFLLWLPILIIVWLLYLGGKIEIRRTPQ